MTVAVKSLDPDVKIVGVQAAAVPGMVASMAEGHPVQCVGAPTMADGIAVQRPGDIPFSILAWAADRIVTVSEAALARGLLLCLERAKQVVEPAGAAGVAALLEHGSEIETPAVVVLSGGNIDPLLLSKLLRHGLRAADCSPVAHRSRGARPRRLAHVPLLRPELKLFCRPDSAISHTKLVFLHELNGWRQLNDRS